LLDEQTYSFLFDGFCNQGQLAHGTAHPARNKNGSAKPLSVLLAISVYLSSVAAFPGNLHPLTNLSR